MSDKGKQIIRRLSETMQKLDEKKQNYILGIAEYMAILKETERTDNARELEEVRR